MQNEKVGNLKIRSYKFSIDIICFLKSLPDDYVNQTIGKQLLRSATSIGANIIEAQAAPSKKDFANFYNIALKSANETKYWLCLLRESSRVAIDSLLQEAGELSNMLARSLLTMRGK